MQIPNDSSTGKPTTRDEHDGFLYRRMAMLGLDLDAIERDHSKVFETLKRRCTDCSFWEACAVDLRRDPSNSMWEAYCPNSKALYALTTLTEVLEVMQELLGEDD